MSSRRPERATTAWSDVTKSLWLFAFLGSGVGDSVMTAAGVSAGAPETNPLAATVLEVAGLPGLDLLKAQSWSHPPCATLDSTGR